VGKKLKLPKTVAGVKVPKSLRKSRRLKAFINNPLGRTILADVLVAAAGAAAVALRGSAPSSVQTANASGKAAAAGARGASDLVQSAVGALSNVVSDVARGIRPDPDSEHQDHKAHDGENDRERKADRANRH
jgi:hypothetical protein